MKKRIEHIHTKRCKHATGEDKEYIEAAIKLGAKEIIITDHAPFPNNPFGNRMQYEELQEYICTFQYLKSIYKKDISILLGLEIEYFPQFDDYYHQLCSIKELNAGLYLGQHMYYENGLYSFAFNKKKLYKEEYLGLGNAIINGINSNFFTHVAHPDRIFRRKSIWDKDCEDISKKIILSAKKHNLPLEINISSIKNQKYYKQFWDLAQQMNANTYIGLDAHSPQEIIEASIYLAE